MNAYDLANELENIDGHEYGEVIYMLRQQADRIAELEKDTELCTTCGGFVFSPLCKQSAEPVAWILESDDSPTEFCWDVKELDEITDVYDMEGWNYKVYPVYTTSQATTSVVNAPFLQVVQPMTAPQIKELSDEEILEVWRENERVYPMDRSRLLDRTRACIKKASEK